MLLTGSASSRGQNDRYFKQHSPMSGGLSGGRANPQHLTTPVDPGLDAVFIASVLVLFVMVARSTRLQFGEPWMGVPFVLLAAACWKMRYIRVAHEVAGFVVAQVGVVAVVVAVWFIAQVGLDGTHPDLIWWAVIPSFPLGVVSIILLRRKWRARNSDN